VSVLVWGIGEAMPSDLQDFSKMSKKFLSGNLAGKALNNENKLILIATYRAFIHSKMDIKHMDQAKISIVIHTSFGGLESVEQFSSGIKKNSLKPNSFACSSPSVPASIISMCWGIRGPSLTVVSPRFSEEAVLESASDLAGIDTPEWVICGYCHFSTLSSVESQNQMQSQLPDFAKIWITKWKI